jgi:DNA-binding CsgD family transcriptional regulator
LRKTGIGLLGDIPWGTHFCHFYETKRDLLDTLLPYFKTGLGEMEFCLWVVAQPLTPQAARNALSRVVPDLDRFIADGSIEIHSGRHWYRRGGVHALKRLTGVWDEKLELALARGFAGLRIGGSTAWLSERETSAFSEYERKVNRSMLGKRMLALCSYPLASSGARHILDVARTHQFALAKRNGKWDVVETPGDLRKETHERRRAAEELRARDCLLSAVAELGQKAIRARELPALVQEKETLQAIFEAADPLDALTPRQREILRLAAEGHSSKEIARTLGLSPRTVEAHRAQLMERLDIHDLAGLVRFAVRVGLVTGDV